MASAGLSRGSHQSPLQELKELLRRTSHVEKALNRLNSDAAPANSGNPFESPSYRGSRLQPDSQSQQLEEQSTTSQELDDPEEILNSGSSDATASPRGGKHRPARARKFRSADHRAGSDKDGQERTSPRQQKPQPQTDSPAVKLQARTFLSSTASKTIPRTPLAVSLAQRQQAEELWQKEKMQLRREADHQRKRASQLEHRLSQLQTIHKHHGTELRAMKAALQQRDARIESLETQGKQENQEAAATVAAFQGQITALKDERQELQRLLGAALEQIQRAGSQASVRDQKNSKHQDASINGMYGEPREDSRAQALYNVLESQLVQNKQRTHAIRQALDEDAEFYGESGDDEYAFG